MNTTGTKIQIKGREYTIETVYDLNEFPNIKKASPNMTGAYVAKGKRGATKLVYEFRNTDYVIAGRI